MLIESPEFIHGEDIKRTKYKGIIVFNDNTVKRDSTVFLIGITILVIAVLFENRIIQTSLGLPYLAFIFSVIYI